MARILAASTHQENEHCHHHHYNHMFVNNQYIFKQLKQFKQFDWRFKQDINHR